MIIHDIPKYETTVPSTGKKIFYRPFLVKEYKVLLIAIQMGSPFELNNAIASIVNACTDNAFDGLSPFFDIEWMFMQIRKKSLKETIDVILEDDNQKFEYQLNLENIVLENPPSKDKNIKISQRMAVEMEYPSFDSYQEMIADKQRGINEFDSLFLLMAKSIKSVYVDNVTHNNLSLDDKQNFINSLTSEQFATLAKFFENLPKLILKETVIGPFSGKPMTIEITDFRDFFV